MSRAKHGEYDAARKQPNNTGKPVGDGWIIRWHAQIVEALGQEDGELLLMESRKQSDPHGWLRAQLVERGYSSLDEAFIVARKAEGVAARIRDKQRIIARAKETLKRNDTDPQHQAYLRKRIDQAQAYLDARAPSGLGE